MDYTSIKISLLLAIFTCIILVPITILLSKWLSHKEFPGRFIILTLIALPLVLPPTVLGFYLLSIFNEQAIIGSAFKYLFNLNLLFSFEGLLIGSLIFNLPFAFQPIHTAFIAVPNNLREAAWTCGLNSWQSFLQIELPLIWPGVLSAFILTFAHTLGEFGVVLMLGGNIPGETKTIAIDIYDQVQLFNYTAAGNLSLILLIFSFCSISSIYFLNQYLSSKLNVRHSI